MKYLHILVLLTTSVISFWCVAKDEASPKFVVLTYGASAVSAEIQKDKRYMVFEENDEENITFSGSVTKEGSGHIVNIRIVREIKYRGYSSNSELSTVVRYKDELGGKPIVIGGGNDAKFSIALSEIAM